MAFIERDPEQMLKYVMEAKKYASSMIMLIRGVQGSLEYYKSELDENCNGAIEKLNTDCEIFLKQVDVYYHLAKQIEKKAKQQQSIKLHL